MQVAGVASIAARLSNRNNFCVSRRIESNNAGFDIGMDRGIREWLRKYYPAWAAAHPPRRKTSSRPPLRKPLKENPLRFDSATPLNDTMRL